MKYNLLLSVLFTIVSIFTAIHEVNHIHNQDTADCVMCLIDDNLVSADLIDKIDNTEILHFEKIVFSSFILNTHNKKSTNQNRAPPKLS